MSLGAALLLLVPALACAADTGRAVFNIADFGARSYPGPHANGIVVDSSRFVRISDCYVDTGDDGIVLISRQRRAGARSHPPSKTGEIVWRRGGTHIGQDLGATDLWVIAAEPKSRRRPL
jgi:hypothetical protein